jgi:pimeloyl-ACP methyl ester carboxylesterase
MWRTALRLLAVVSCVAAGRALAQPKAAPDVGVAAYGAPHQLVPIAPGRRINVVCMGQGAPTVILSAGAAAWSYAWFRVQPIVARKTRVCSWDRAGNGFSDASPEPQDVVHIAADLEKALEGAGVDGPLIVVGHSQGGIESLIFADRHPKRIAGLVLVDPASPDQAERLRRAAPSLMTWSEDGDYKAFAPVRDCVTALKRQAPGAPQPDVCGRLRRGPSARFGAALLPWDRQPAYWETYYSDFEQRDRNAKISIKPGRNYGDTPIIVLGSGMLSVPGAPAAALRELPALKAEIEHSHRELAQLSSRGTYIPVPDSGHAIMLQKPDVVVSSIERLVDEARGANH